MSSPSRPARQLDGLVLPADLEQPPRRETIQDAPRLVTIVGGELEAISSPAHRDLRAYIAAGENTTGRPVNERATRVMRPGASDAARIVGDVVLLGFDKRARMACDVTEEQEQRITGPGPIHYPDRRELRGARHLAYSWDLTTLPDGRLLQASLNVRYHDSLSRGVPGQFVAYLTNEAVTAAGADAERMVHGMWFGSLKVLHDCAFSAPRRDRFASWTLDRVRSAFLLSYPGIHGMFRVP